MDKMHEIWCEGYVAIGQNSGAIMLGYSKGKNLKDACINYAKKDSEFAKYFDVDSMTYWGCRIFDNEIDARKSFG